MRAISFALSLKGRSSNDYTHSLLAMTQLDFRETNCRLVYCLSNLLFRFAPGDKIVTVNGKSLSGLTYRESTDFIRQCPGPNVKMGIIKHALYKKEGIVLVYCNECYRLVRYGCNRKLLKFVRVEVKFSLISMNLNKAYQ